MLSSRLEVDGDVANFELNSSVIVESTRFDPVEDDERDRILDGLHSDNTKKATKRYVKLFQSWLSQISSYFQRHNVHCPSVHPSIS